MVRKNVQFLSLLLFGLLVLAISFTLPGEGFFPKTTLAVENLKAGTTFAVLFGGFSLVLIGFYIKLRGWIK